MNAEELRRKIEQDSFEVNLDINVDVKSNRGFVDLNYLKTPKDKKFMYVNVLLWYATRLLWVAQSTGNNELVYCFTQFIPVAEGMELVTRPMDNKILKVYSIGSLDNSDFSLDYEGYALGGMFAKDIPARTLYGFCALYKYFNTHVLPIRENINFIMGVNVCLGNLLEMDFCDADPRAIRDFCIKYTMELICRQDLTNE